MPRLPRRDFLRAGLAGSLLAASSRLAGASPTAPAAPAILRARPAAPARNVIFLVSDGMSLGTLALAERHLRRHAGRGTRWLGLYARPDIRRALMDTASASSPVTDSAAASSAWGCGQKVNNGSINHAPDGRPLEPILRLARAAGLATGLVSTATITHATPAGFVAQAEQRSAEEDIATQYLDQRIDVILGGGKKFFAPATRPDKRDLAADFATAGYRIALDRAALLAPLHLASGAAASAASTAPSATAPAGDSDAAPLLGLFADGHLPYSLDHRADPALGASVPTLAEMPRVALARLGARDRGFVLQVEGARVDHAAHANDLGGLLYDQLAFDDALGVALDFVADRDDTLVIVTSDHGNANPGLNGTGGSFNSRGGSYGDTQACFDRAAALRQTNVWALEGLHADSTLAEVRERVGLATAIGLLDDEVEIVRHALRKEHREGYRVRNAPLVALGQVLSNYTAVGWTGVQHTTDFTELAAFGPGSESIQGLVQNTALFGVMTRALGLSVPA